MSVEAYPLTMSSFEGVSGSRMKPSRPEGSLTGSWSLLLFVTDDLVPANVTLSSAIFCGGGKRRHNLWNKLLSFRG